MIRIWSPIVSGGRGRDGREKDVRAWRAVSQIRTTTKTRRVLLNDERRQLKGNSEVFIVRVTNVGGPQRGVHASTHTYTFNAFAILDPRKVYIPYLFVYVCVCVHRPFVPVARARAL